MNHNIVGVAQTLVNVKLTLFLKFAQIINLAYLGFLRNLWNVQKQDRYCGTFFQNIHTSLSKQVRVTSLTSINIYCDTVQQILNRVLIKMMNFD